MIQFLVLAFSLHAVAANFPHENALSDWHEDQKTIYAVNLAALLSPAICGQTLYPTHPEQTLKRYHTFEFAQYDASKIPPRDPLCLTPAMNGRVCLRADTANHIILSDTYTDACGILVRGFAEVRFVGQDETMGTMVSPGRTIYPKPDAEFEEDFVYGETWAVPSSAFLKIGPLFDGDLAKISAARVLFKNSYDSFTHLYK